MNHLDVQRAFCASGSLIGRVGAFPVVIVIRSRPSRWPQHRWRSRRTRRAGPAPRQPAQRAIACATPSSDRHGRRGCGSSPGSSTCSCATARASPAPCRCCPTPWPRRGGGRDGTTLTVEGYRAQRRDPRRRRPLGRPALRQPSRRPAPAAPVDPAPARHPSPSTATRSAAGSPAARSSATRAVIGSSPCSCAPGWSPPSADTFELAHEALARAWPRLRSWLDDDVAGQRVLRHLVSAADGWDSPRPPGHRALPRRPAGNGARVARPRVEPGPDRDRGGVPRRIGRVRRIRAADPGCGRRA